MPSSTSSDTRAASKEREVDKGAAALDGGGDLEKQRTETSRGGSRSDADDEATLPKLK